MHDAGPTKHAAGGFTAGDAAAQRPYQTKRANTATRRPYQAKRADATARQPYPASLPSNGGGFQKAAKPGFGRGGEVAVPAAPDKLQTPGVKGVGGQDQPRPLFRSQPPLDERQIQVGVAAVEFVTHNGMAEVREVEAELMLATSERAEAEKGE